MRNQTSLILLVASTLAVWSADRDSAAPMTPKPEPRLRLVSQSSHESYLSYMPHTTDGWFNALKEKDIVFYDESSMPKAYQHRGGIHNPSYNISAVRHIEAYGNGNLEFPWGRPAGLRVSSNGRSLKFAVFPAGASILWWWERLRGEPVYRWQYPKGTVFGEVLLVCDPEGDAFAFEARTRVRTEDGWRVNVYRPFGTPQELASRVKELAPAWEKDEALVKLAEGQPASDDGRYHLYNQHPTGVFNRVALTRTLPPIDHALVRRLLTETKFRSVMGQEWARDEDGTDCHAPTTEADFHIVPRGYEGHYLEVSTKKCMTCHDSTGKHVDEFHAERDWYGRVRGSDGIFSFHIFDPTCISNNGFNVQVRFRQELVDAVLLKRWE